jgi:hypothetical protein
MMMKHVQVVVCSYLTTLSSVTEDYIASSEGMIHE